MVREIPLTHGRVALVDDHDFDWLSAFRWMAKTRQEHRYEGGDGHWSAVTSIRQGGKKRTIQMGRLILLPLPKFHVDHINGDGLDNRRCNLRVVTAQENAFNRRRNRANRTGFKGVTQAERGQFVAVMTLNGKRIELGIFADAISAAQAYDDASRIHHGQFARLNFPAKNERAA